MLEFLDIEWRNFLSYGQNWHSFKFEKGICRITGINGHGKSAIMEVVYFALFGRPYRKIKANQLINSMNKKNLEVKMQVKKGNEIFRIERGLKPDYFKIYRDDVLEPVSSSKRGYQEILEQDILHLNENIVNQIMIKSLTKNISFMTIMKAEKRAIIENLLDIELFSTISKNIKVKLDNLDFSLASIKKDIENITLLIEQELSSLEQLKNIKRKIENESKIKVEEINKEINELETTNVKYNLALGKIATNKTKKKLIQTEIQKTKEIIKVIREEITSRQADLKLAEKKIKLFKDTCGNCPKINEMLKIDNSEKITDNITINEQKINDARRRILDEEAKLQKIDEILANEKFIRSGIEKNLKRIEELEKSAIVEVNKEIKIDETKLKKYQKNKKQFEGQFNDFANQKKHYLILKSLYSDDGIKSFIIKKYLPHINKLLNTYLQKFNTDIIFNFDTDFNEVVLSKYKEAFSYFSFSEGQKKRIDLAVLFAFINFAMFKNKKSNTNLLFLDEILSGLDVEGKNRLHELLREYRDAQNKCIITISHESDIDPDLYNKVYDATLNKGFSTIKQIDN